MNRNRSVTPVDLLLFFVLRDNKLNIFKLLLVGQPESCHVEVARQLQTTVSEPINQALFEEPPATTSRATGLLKMFTEDVPDGLEIYFITLKYQTQSAD